MPSIKWPHAISNFLSAFSPKNTFFGWDQLTLLLTPFPIFAVARIAYVLGMDSDGADRIAAIYADPILYAVIISVLMSSVVFSPDVLLAAPAIFFIIRNIWLRRPKRLVLYGLVLIALPIGLKKIDLDYWRFVLHETRYKTSLSASSGPMAPNSASCAVFDRVQDNFSLGGVRFLPFEKLVLYVSEDTAGRETPHINSFVEPNQCPNSGTVGQIRHLKGRFYLAETRRDY